MKNTVSNLNNTQSLITLISKILEKQGLNNINALDDYIISADENSVFGKRPYSIVCTLSELNGKVQFIKEKIESQPKDNNFIVVSSNKKKISNYFKDWLQKELRTDKIDFWEETKIIELIDKYLPEYWGHNDLFLKAFEDSFLTHLENNGELQKVLKLDKKFEELLNIFIEPKIYQLKDDPKTQRLIRVKFKISQYIDGNNYFISGDAGTGKTTLLKEIGKIVIDKNNNSPKKTLPIRLKTTLIANSSFSINDAIDREVQVLIGSEKNNIVFDDYRILLLIDSIDEFETEKQQSIFNELNDLVSTEDLNFVIATRNYENLTKNCQVCDHTHTMLSNFDLHQVKEYLTTFFKRDLKKSDELWESLLENKILERVPPTPLTISLVSILYEENGYEIPATITDVYDNFNTFLLGRLNVNTNLDFLKINVKEKILSMYALEIIQTPNRKRKDKNQFIEYIINYFKEQSITIAEDLIPELVKGMTDGTGILYIDDQGYITYQHDHFMEYYASREIFFQEDRAELEKQIIERFTEYNWQNTAIFYTGRTKDMKKFLDALVERVYRYNQLHEHLLAISGLGYVLQSLWMTNSQNRKKAVIAALDLLIKADAEIKRLAEQRLPFFKDVKDVDIATANLAWFYMHYNSLTLRDPLQLAFDEIHNNLSKLGNTVFDRDRITILYKLFCIAATLNTGRIKDDSKLEVLFNEEKLLTIPLFVFLFNEAIDILEYSNEAKIRKDYKLASKKRKYSESIKFYLDNNSEAVRHTTFEQLTPIKNVELYTEGKTDASLISHAFKILTMGQEPYWNITAIENIHTSKAGGAQQLAANIKSLSEEIESESDKLKTVIAIFDNDSKGYQEFNGLPATFKDINGILKKAEGQNIFAMLLPIPEEEVFKPYHQEKQAFKFFEIENYLPLEILKEQKAVTEISIPGIFEITGSKANLNDIILKLKDAQSFKYFSALFTEIDNITKEYVNYID